eukprot:scaffold134_cov409-Pavlova_lutheri.AAC.2
MDEDPIEVLGPNIHPSVQHVRNPSHWECIATHALPTGFADVKCSSVPSLHTDESLPLSYRKRAQCSLQILHPCGTRAITVGSCASHQGGAFQAGLIECVQRHS